MSADDGWNRNWLLQIWLPDYHLGALLTLVQNSPLSAVQPDRCGAPIMNTNKWFRIGTRVAWSLLFFALPLTLVFHAGCQSQDQQVASQKDKEPPGGNKMPSESRK